MWQAKLKNLYRGVRGIINQRPDRFGDPFGRKRGSKRVFRSSLTSLMPMFLVLSTLLLSGCNDLLSKYFDKQCVDMKFERFIETDQIIIVDNMDNKLLIIVGKEIINKIVDFSLSHKTNWFAPFGGTPIPFFSANFYNKGRFIGDLGVGDNALVAQGCGYFYSKEISIKDKNFIINTFLNTQNKGSK